MLKTEFILSGEFQENCYIVYEDSSKKAIIIDPGQDGKKVIDKIENLKLKPELLINTHGHFDHTFSDDIIRQKYNIPLAIHKNDTEMLSNPELNFSEIIGKPTIIKDAEIIFNTDEQKETSFCKYSVIHTPGHSKGSVCILIDKILFSGDTLFKDSIGRTDLHGGNYSTLISSLQKIKELSADTIVCPGHGPFTILKNELENNPYLK